MVDSFHSPQHSSSLPALMLQEKKHTCLVVTSARQANRPERLPSGSSVQLSPPQHMQAWRGLELPSLRKAAGGRVPRSAHNTFMHTGSKKQRGGGGVCHIAPANEPLHPNLPLIWASAKAFPQQVPSPLASQPHRAPVSPTFTKHHCLPAERGPKHQ